MTFDQMLERVRCKGAHPTRERAEGAVRTVMAALGRRLTGGYALLLGRAELRRPRACCRLTRAGGRGHA
ncbi:hypothetical protein [Streptomyces sp. NPDC058623]|uniref:hypothetical protein n=1 Tax=Streptomyces sp. NPDC058623 TaxID=3346563 RepID=UPI003664EED5